MSKPFEFEKVSVEDAAKAIAPATPAVGEVNWSDGRLPATSEPLAGDTVAWLASLPPGIAPQELARQFPRVANELCAYWKRPARCEVYLNELMLAQRNGRAGFPSAVMKELGMLTAHYAELYPARESAWSQLNKR